MGIKLLCATHKDTQKCSVQRVVDVKSLRFCLTDDIP